MTAGAMILLWIAPSAAPVVPQAPRPPAAFTLRWNAPPGCGSVAAIEARVAALLSGPPGGEGVADVIATVQRSPSQVTLELTTRFEGAQDVRRMTASSCDDVVEATAVLLSVALEPSLSSDVAARPERDPVPREEEAATVPAPISGAPRPAPLAGGDATPDPPAAADPPRPGPAQTRAEAPRRRRDVALSLGVAGGAEYGGLRAVTGAVRMSLGARGRSWSAEALGTYLTPRRLRDNGIGGRYQLGAAGLRGCWHRGGPGDLKWGGEACGGAEAGGLRVDSEGLSPAVSTTGPFVGPSASVAGSYAWPYLAVVLRAEGVARALGSRTRVGGEVLVEQFPVSFRMFVGVRMLFSSFAS